MKKILFLGDFYYDYDNISEDIQKLSQWIKDNDYVTILNLEGGIKSEPGKPIEKRGPNLASSITAVEVLKKLNVIGVCLANNHTMDFGMEGLANTIRVLDKNNIKHTGAGMNLNQALACMTFEIGYLKYAILNFGWDVEETVYASENKSGCAPRNEKIILESIKKAKGIADRVIVCIHWGFEYNRLPMPVDIALAHKMIDMGAELVIGHHPHCIQPKELYSNKSIYYCLGNFYFGTRRERFKKKFKEKIVNQSDFGAMVSYDPITRECKHFLIQYNSEKKQSILETTTDLDVLEDITGVDYCSHSYKSEVKKRKRNINPILMLDERKNEIAVRRLYAFYDFKKVIKTLIYKRK